MSDSSGGGELEFLLASSGSQGSVHTGEEEGQTEWLEGCFHADRESLELAEFRTYYEWTLCNIVPARLERYNQRKAITTPLVYIYVWVNVSETDGSQQTSLAKTEATGLLKQVN